MPPPPPLRQPPELLEELVVEILLRISPNDPADLLRASLVCKSWRRFLSDPVFRQRYCRYHRTPPLLGFVADEGHSSSFVSTVASPCSMPTLDCFYWWVLDSRHGRILIHTFQPSEIVVWDPLTRERKRVPSPPYPHSYYYTGAVLCDTAGCDHLGCHGGPFRLFYVGADGDGSIWVSVYSSETGAWDTSSSIKLDVPPVMWPILRMEDALYFMADQGRSILVYNMVGRSLSVIEAPNKEDREGSIVMMLEDSRLGLVQVVDRMLYLWSREEAGADGTAGWKQWRVIDLATLLPLSTMFVWITIVGFVEGTDTIFLSTNEGIFTLKIKAGRVKKVGERGSYSVVIPYTGFYLPRA
ncbi:hypothetical protein EJB05_15379, partial [Eragrostis curvula]